MENIVNCSIGAMLQLPRTIPIQNGKIVKLHNPTTCRIAAAMERMKLADAQIEELLAEVNDSLKPKQANLSAMGGATELPFSYEITKLMDVVFTASILEASPTLSR